MNWIVNLDNATFDFAENVWLAADLELTGAELRRFNAQHPRNPDGTFREKGSKGDTGDSGDGDNKNGSSSKKPSGKSSGPARFQDSNGDGKDDRQLSPAEMRKALAGLPKEMRDALAVYPSVLGAVAMAIANGENLRKHLERLPSNLRDAAERAAKKVADDKESSDGSGQTPKDATKLSEAEVERLTDAGWAGNPNDSAERLYPPGHPKNPKSSGGSRKGMVRAEDGSWVPRSFYNSEGSQWFVDLDELPSRDIKSLAPTDVLIKQMDWATFVERDGKTLKKFEQPGGESPDTNLDRAKDWALRFAKKLDGEHRVFLSVDESGQIDEEITRQSGA